MAEIAIRPFADDDASQVRELFVAVNRLFSPPDVCFSSIGLPTTRWCG